MRAVPAQFLDLEGLVKGRSIDLLKVDIEGAKFDFVEQYPQLLGGVRAVMIEIHAAPEAKQRRLHSLPQQAGLRRKAPPLERGGAILSILQRW